MQAYTSDTLRGRMDANMTPTPNALLSSEMSASAKLVWIHMFSKPHGWDFSAERVGDALGLSEKFVRNCINELIDEEWLIRFFEGRRSRYVFLVPNECVSDYDELNAGIGHTYGGSWGAGSNEDAPKSPVPSLCITNAVLRLKDAYMAYPEVVENDIVLMSLAKMCEDVESWQEFDELTHQIFTVYMPFEMPQN